MKLPIARASSTGTSPPLAALAPFTSIPMLDVALRARRHPRVDLRTEVWLGQDGIFTRAPKVLRDLSEKGAFVETDQQFTPGSILHLCFRLPTDDHLITSTVAVRHQRSGRGVGIEFLDISPQNRRSLRAFVGEPE